ncbi:MULTISPECIES: hypothetical protein [unclassified Oceanobacillus]|uniref:hypothetical protein n=1 Tax=unclassified Oceanobacillus TaxID=2630292 RepID=UPI00300E3E4B
MARIMQEYCNDCRKDTWHEYVKHSEFSLLTKCSLCGARFDLIPNGQTFIVEGTNEYFKIN